MKNQIIEVDFRSIKSTSLQTIGPAKCKEAPKQAKSYSEKAMQAARLRELDRLLFRMGYGKAEGIKFIRSSIMNYQPE